MMTRVESYQGRSSRLQVRALVAAAALLPRYRGMARVAAGVGRFFPKNNAVVLRLPWGRMRILLDDGYWVRLLFDDYRYEPELEDVLSEVFKEAGPSAVFIDGGANIGFWAVYAASRLNVGNVLAIEMQPRILEQLEENSRLNGGSIVVAQAALWDKPGQHVAINIHSPGQHAAASVAQADTSSRDDRLFVKTETLDGLSARLPVEHTLVVLKLDVEGAEVQALEGGMGLLETRDVVLIFEDHGKDPTCSVTDYVLNKLGWSVFLAHPDLGIVRIAAVSELAALKVQTWRGYNLVAGRSGLPAVRRLEASARAR